ncbi:serine hydrolase domain-containing protein [Mycobacterium sp. ITM-2016-00318]|uniref:esterase/beta-lactamase LipL n=1 Tax=Mycobacterium sp. ITM-2016-00318 TaxID=2099693 RepID=UPI001E40D259|nr:serine hydrolase domain-containing protein [Mycobacterium sp. ITM-2016-00318]WNG95197.1 serine hydrolase domain-containing protein [Mycobacterium sp. ITM-2016-00318]
MTHSDSVERSAALPHGVQGAADPRFACAVRAFSTMFPGPRYGGGALSVYLDGEPVVDVWTGWSDRAGTTHWSADTGAMVFSATKGMAATVIHRLADRGLIDYEAPVAQYWPEFGANGKAHITVRDMMRHRAGLSQLNGVSRAELMDHLKMEERLAAAPVNKVLYGKGAYHALTYGWLMSGLARSVTGKGMRELIREELAEPLEIDGLHLGRPPVGSPTTTSQIIIPQGTVKNALLGSLVPKLAALQWSSGLGALYFPEMVSVVQGDTPFLDGEIPAANGTATARGLAKMYAALACGGMVDGKQFLSPELAAGLIGRPNLRPDRNIVFPMAFHLGYHSIPLGGLMPGFGHAGLGGSLGWADPTTGMSFGYVHNRLLTPFVLADQAGFVATAALIRRGATAARKRGYRPVPAFGAPFVGEQQSVAL